MDDLLKIVAATLSGMDVDVFRNEVAAWIASARDPRWKRPYTDLVCKPQPELLDYLRENGFKSCTVTGVGQDFVRTYSERINGIQREQIAGSAGDASCQYAADRRRALIKEPKLLPNDDRADKLERIHLVIGRSPLAGLRLLAQTQIATIIGRSARRWIARAAAR